MARGLDKDSGKTPPRRNPFRQPIAGVGKEEIEEKKKEINDKQKAEEARARAEAEAHRLVDERLDVQELRDAGWSEGDIERERRELREQIALEQERKAFVEVRDEIMLKKKKEAEDLITKRKDYLTSLGLEDIGHEWEGITEKYIGLIPDEYEIHVAPITDPYLKEQGHNFAFVVSYSPDAALLDIYRHNGQWTNDNHFITETLDKGEAEKKINQFIEESAKARFGDNGAIAKDLAASEEEARRKAEEAIAEKRAVRLEEAKEHHGRIAKRQEEERTRREAQEREEREREEAQKAYEEKKQATAKVFDGLEWSDPKFSSLRSIEKKIVHLTENGRDFKREKIGDSDLITFYEDIPGGYGTPRRKHAVGGIVFYKGKLKAIIGENDYGVTVASQCTTEEKYGISYPYGSNDKTLFELGKWASRRRHKRKGDPAKIRAQVEAAAKEYVEELIRQEALKNIS